MRPVERERRRGTRDEEGRVVNEDGATPSEGGAHPVEDHPAEVPTGGRTVLQTVVLVVGGLVILAALLWLLVPLGGG